MNLVRRASSSPVWQSAAGMSLSDFDRVLDQLYGGQPSWSGASVSQQTSLGVSAIWACVNALANDIATLPLLTYERTKAGREPAESHYLWDLFLLQTNPEMSAYTFFHFMQFCLCLWGNACAEIEINGRGQITALHPWRWDRVKIGRAGADHTGPIEYRYKLPSGGYTPAVPRNRMFHIHGPSLDGVIGLSPIEIHRQTVGLALAISEHGARFFSNGARPLGIISVDHEMGESSYNRLKLDWNNKHQGLANAHRVAILEEGATWSESGENMVDAQYIESFNLTREEVCSIYNVPPHRIGILDKMNNSIAEELSLNYVLYSLAPLCANWQNQIHCDLLSARENKQIYCAFDFLNLLRGNMDATQKFISAMIDRGVINVDTARTRFLGLNALPHGLGSSYWKASNQMDIDGDAGANKNSPANVPTVKKIPANQPQDGDENAGKGNDKQNGNGNGNGNSKDKGNGKQGNAALYADIQRLLADPARCAQIVSQFANLQ